MPYPNALLQATPRNALLGNVADFIAQSYSPERTQQAQGVANYLMLPQISRTLDRLSYGEPLTTGAGGIGGTTRFNNDALDAAMAIAPAVGPAAKLAGKGAMATGRAGERYAEKVVPQIMQRGGLGAEMLGAMGNRTVSPLDVYHGTPHTLPPTARNPLGEFDASKIGTGEGAQAYGHGIYTAEAKDTGRRYQMGLTQSLGQEVMYKDKPLNALYSQIEDRANKLSGKAADIENQKLQLVEHMMLDKSPDELVSYARETGFDPSVVKWMESDVAKNTKIPGNLYKIDLPDEKIANMLDWDKPLHQQSASVQAALNKLGFVADKNKINEFDDALLSALQGGSTDLPKQPVNLTGDVIYRKLGSPQIAAQRLMQEGIPGVKYLDEFSRGAGQGTRNFVTFPGEEKNLTILERNGQRFDNSALK